MSINRNVNLIKAIQPQVNRNPVSYNFDANLFAIGAGGGGETSFDGGGAGDYEAGGGGGGGAVVSASISVVPNITWTVDVGEGGSADTNGGDTLLIAYDGNYSGQTTLKAQGGLAGSNSGGGNSGTGSLETTAVTQSYSGFTGGAQNLNVAGGGAGSSQNGGAGVPYDGNPGTGLGGPGGAGDNIFSGIAGGGGGGITPNNINGGTASDGGGTGGDLSAAPSSFNGNPATNYGGGGGGAAAADGITGTGGSGFKGSVIVQFTGVIGTELDQFDIVTTNASSSYDSLNNRTTVFFETGSGTFRYNAPFPYVPGN
jgi:hypothetical protein